MPGTDTFSSASRSPQFYDTCDSDRFGSPHCVEHRIAQALGTAEYGVGGRADSLLAPGLLDSCRAVGFVIEIERQRTPADVCENLSENRDKFPHNKLPKSPQTSEVWRSEWKFLDGN